MRLWSIHPKYLDAVGLVALWRESLLAQKILREEIKGYRNHPQLKRFRRYPLRAISNYLMGIWEESKRRGYHFDKRKIRTYKIRDKIPITRGQLRYEFHWLCDKLKSRRPHGYQELLSVKEIEPHPTFEVVEGEIEEWEWERTRLNVNQWCASSAT